MNAYRRAERENADFRSANQYSRPQPITLKHPINNKQHINMSGNLPMGSAYPPRPLAEPRSGRYAGCKRAAGEVFGCIPHGCAGEAKLRREAARSAPEGTARGRARALR